MKLFVMIFISLIIGLIEAKSLPEPQPKPQQLQETKIIVEEEDTSEVDDDDEDSSLLDETEFIPNESPIVIPDEKLEEIYLNK